MGGVVIHRNLILYASKGTERRPDEHDSPLSPITSNLTRWSYAVVVCISLVVALQFGLLPVVSLEHDVGSHVALLLPAQQMLLLIPQTLEASCLVSRHARAK